MIASGDVQWMTAGSGIIHQEMPKGNEAGHMIFAYIIEGKAWFNEQKDAPIYNENLVLFHDGEHIVISTEDDPVRFLLISGQPIGEPVAWRGPIVMNTQQELRTAFEEYGNGTFIKHKKG